MNKVNFKPCMTTNNYLGVMLLMLLLLAPPVIAQSISSNPESKALPAAIENGPAVSPIVVSLPLKQASAIVEEALKVGRNEQMLPLTVVVLDSGGHMVAVKREDGSGIFRIEVANAKAYGALGMGVSTRVMGQRLDDRPVFAGALNGLSDGQWVPVPGGVLIRNAQNQVIGSVGISGDTSDRDEFAAINAVKAADLYPEPLNPNTAWQESHL
jgi:uncharacterized protein GlcG (DUF336 family)